MFLGFCRKYSIVNSTVSNAAVIFRSRDGYERSLGIHVYSDVSVCSRNMDTKIIIHAGI